MGSFRQEQLEKKESAGEKAKWCKNDAFILVRKCVLTFQKNALAQDCFQLIRDSRRFRLRPQDRVVERYG